MSHVKVCSSTTYPIFIAKFGELPIESYVRRLTMGFQQWLTHLSPSCQVSTTIIQHMAEQRFNTWYKSTTMWTPSWGLSY